MKAKMRKTFFAGFPSEHTRRAQTPETAGYLFHSSDGRQPFKALGLVMSCAELLRDLRSANNTCLSLSCVLCILSHVLKFRSVCVTLNPVGACDLAMQTLLVFGQDLVLAAPSVDWGPVVLTSEQRLRPHHGLGTRTALSQDPQRIRMHINHVFFL